MAKVWQQGSGMPEHGDIYIDPKTGMKSYYNSKAGSWVSEAEQPQAFQQTPANAEYNRLLSDANYMNALKTSQHPNDKAMLDKLTQYQAQQQRTGNIQQAVNANNPNYQYAQNLSVLAPTSPLDNPIVQNIPLTNEFIQQKLALGENARLPLGMAEQDAAFNTIKQGAGPTELEGKIRGAYGGYTTPAGMKAYQDALYESVAQRLRTEAGDLRSQQAADLASRGLGMSTVVNDVQAETNKRLLQGLGEAGSRAAVGAEELRRGYLQDAQNLESGIANRGLQAGTQMSNVGAQKQNIYQSAQSPYMQAIQYQDANSLLNLGLQNQAWKDKVANAQYLLNLPQQINAGQAGTQNNAANVGGKVYDANLQSAATQNETAGKVAEQIANATTPKTGFVPLQQVQGGFNGAVTGVNAGFANPVKKTYTGQIAT